MRRRSSRAHGPAPAARGTALLDLEVLGPHLLHRGLLPRASVVDGEVIMEDLSRRNRAFRVTWRGGGIHVKQAGNPAQASMRASVATEAAMLRAFARAPSFRRSRSRVPRFVHFEPENVVLASRLLHPATTLTKYHLNVGDVRFPPEAGATTGKLLAELHAAGKRALRRGGLRFLPEGPPRAWDVLEGPGARTTVEMAAAATLSSKVRNDKGLAAAMRAARARWASADPEFLHGDVRWDNFLLVAGNARGWPLNLHLVDWEFARRGDAAWDLACCLAEPVRFWLTAMMQDRVASLAEADARQPFSLDVAHPENRACWKSYVRGRRISSTGATALRAACLDYLPLVYLVHGFEAVQDQARAPDVSLLALEMASRAAADSTPCARAWVGIDGGS